MLWAWPAECSEEDDGRNVKLRSEELEKHYMHPDNGLFVSGIGGRGEIEFIKGNPTIDGYLVVYHAITNCCE